MLTFPIEPGQRRTATILGNPQAVRVIEPSCYEPRCWICKFETTHREGVVAEYEFGELLPESRGDPSSRANPTRTAALERDRSIR
ncbi:MAG TPA: hypothetical protein VMV69_23285 [Pirellulales bacterium]|nr:hypothetical protein [Pirellulales bacterium]